MKFEMPEYLNTKKPVTSNEEKLSNKKCYVCDKVVKMTRFQRFCKNCRSYVKGRYGYI